MLREFDCEALEQGQINNAALIQKLMGVYGVSRGYGMFNDLRWINDPDALTYIHPAAGLLSMAARTGAQETAAGERTAGETPGTMACDFDALAREMGDRQDEIRDNMDRINARVKMGSYAWVVSGSKTADHKPIIYSGPQMGFSSPPSCARVLSGAAAWPYRECPYQVCPG
jgi:penicillin amidase